MKSPLARFIVTTLAWLPVTFAVWYFGAPALLWPVELLAAGVVHAWFPDLVQAIDLSGGTMTFLTTLRPGQSESGGQVSVDVNPLLYAYGLPMFAALVLAAREPRWPRYLLIGLFALMPFIAWGVLADFLKNVAIGSGPLVASQTGFTSFQRELIAFAFQFGSLILPTVAPAALWVLLHRRFLERLREPDPVVHG